MPDITIPTSSDELEEMLNDPRRMQGVFGNKELFGQFIRNYAQTVQAKDQSIATQVREETQRVLGEWLRENQQENTRRLNLTPGEVEPLARQRSRLYNRKAPGASIDAEFDGSADYFRHIWHHRGSLNLPDVEQKLDRIRRIQNSYGTIVPADGGFLVPETLRSELLSVSLETSIVRPRARVIPMESQRVPIPAIDDTSHASSVHGGFVFYWTEEGATLTESQASFGRVVLDAKKLTGYAEAPNELIADAPAFGAVLDQMFPEALAWFEDDAFINGSGVGEPLGVLNSGAIVSVTRVTADRIFWPDVVAMYSRMLPQSLGRAVWIAAPDALPELFQMTVNVKNVAGTENVGGSAVYIQNGAEGPPTTILGRPLFVSEKIPKLTDPNALVFVDLGYYLIGDRQAMTAQSSPHYKFANDKTAFRIIERVDGRPWLSSAITPKNGGASLTPYVGLST